AETLRQSDLNALKLDLERQVGATVRRLEELERQGSASARVIANAAPAVVLLQGGYGLREIGGERLMRLVLTEEGLPIMLPTGQPLMSLDGDGPVAEVNYVSTGFLVGSEGAILTNRHVALPWESTVDEAALASSGLQPVMLKLIAYLPGHAEAAPVTLIGASERADLAVLKSEQALAANVGLPLAQAEPAAGEPIIVMGYPTGLKSILAQAGRSFVEKLQTDEDLEFWRDAETTHGGSGGPVLTMEGEVIAVTMAVLPEYGGSNLGVPIAEARRLLAELGLD
ncbi:MAG: serine protease, partial [Pseudomonadota bacterium]